MTARHETRVRMALPPMMQRPTSGRQIEMAEQLAKRLAVNTDRLIFALADMGAMLADELPGGAP